jgi:hypothetical protein
MMPGAMPLDMTEWELVHAYRNTVRAGERKTTAKSSPRCTPPLKEGTNMSKNKKQTSAQVASLAASILKDESASKTAKSLAGSVLAQTHSKSQTGPEMEDLASTVLKSSKYGKETKALAGSVLSQSNKER